MYQRKFDEKLAERFFNTYTFCNHDKSKFILLLRKSVYPYEYIDDWKKSQLRIITSKKKIFTVT